MREYQGSQEMREYLGKPRDERVSGEAKRWESIWGSQEMREYLGKPRDERVCGKANIREKS